MDGNDHGLRVDGSDEDKMCGDQSVGEVLRAFVRAGSRVGGPPTIVEVAEEIGVSKTTARAQLAFLVKQGFLDQQEGRHRGYSLSPVGMRVV